MQSLNILLLNALLRNNWNMRLACRRADRFGVIAVVLLPAHEWFYILQAYQINLMSERLKLTGPKKAPVEASMTTVQGLI